MSTHHIFLYDLKRNKPISALLKQELITYEQTQYGLRILKLERRFPEKEHSDSYKSSPGPLSFAKQEGYMNYKLKEIECEEDFIKAFGENPGWILSPVRLRKPKQKSEETPSPDKKGLAEE